MSSFHFTLLQPCQHSFLVMQENRKNKRTRKAQEVRQHLTNQRTLPLNSAEIKLGTKGSGNYRTNRLPWNIVHVCGSQRVNHTSSKWVTWFHCQQIHPAHFSLSDFSQQHTRWFASQRCELWIQSDTISVILMHLDLWRSLPVVINFTITVFSFLLWLALCL